ncbi:MAG: extracellular solute-binding protein [Chloroflexota bacterium]
MSIEEGFGAAEKRASVSRRQFIRWGAGGALASTVALPLLLEACGSAASPASSSASVTASGAASGAPASAGAAAASTFTTPTFVAFNGPKPDIPGNDKGLPPAYGTYPKNLVKSVQSVPGKGGPVSTMTFTIGAPPPPVSQNTAWQEVNKQLGVTLSVNAVAAPDYLTKLTTTVAGGALPDMFYISVIGTSLQNMPQFMETSCADLTPYLSGSAIKAFPNLANFPAFRWPYGVFNKKLYAVPAASITGQAMFAKGKVLDAAGLSSFTNQDDFLKGAKAITKPGSQYALVGTGSGYNSWNPLGWFMQVFRTPNDWRNDGGKLTKDIETPEFKEAVAFVRSLWDAGVMHPDSPSLNLTTAVAQWYAGKVIMYQNGYNAYALSWDRAVLQDPNFKPTIVPIFGYDGKPGVSLLGNTSSSLTVLKKASPDRIKELLGILDFMVAPFGSQENQLLNFGVQDKDFSYAKNGDPVLTKQGQSEVTSFPIWKLSAPADVLYDQHSTAFAKAASEATSAALDIGVPSPVVGLYSQTAATKGAVLNQKLTDGLNSIIYGRAAVSTLGQLVKDWQTGGGNDIRTELEKALAG